MQVVSTVSGVIEISLLSCIFLAWNIAHFANNCYWPPNKGLSGGRAFNRTPIGT
jgi:hypothetical protein